MNGKWKATNERTVYDNWLQVFLYDVTLPDGTEKEHHVIRAGEGSAGVVAHDTDKGVLLVWRHRTSTDRWGWEIPGGRIEHKEWPEAAAEREMREETGWRPGKLKPLLDAQPLSGMADHPFHFFYTDSATWEGPAPDANEAADISWIPIPQIKNLMQKGEIADGFTLMPLLWAFTFGPLSGDGV